MDPNTDAAGAVGATGLLLGPASAIVASLVDIGGRTEPNPKPAAAGAGGDAWIVDIGGRTDPKPKPPAAAGAGFVA